MIATETETSTRKPHKRQECFSFVELAERWRCSRGTVCKRWATIRILGTTNAQDDAVPNPVPPFIAGTDRG